MKTQPILLKRTLIELSKLADDPQRRAARYRLIMWIWLLAACAALIASIGFQKHGDATHRDAPFALMSGFLLGMVFYYRSASRQAEIIASVLDREKLKERLDSL